MSPRRKKRPLPVWTPFEKATEHRGGYDYPVGSKAAEEMRHWLGTWVNSRYQVAVFADRVTDWRTDELLDVVHLSIKNQGRGARHDWRDFQKIKNELVGEEWWAVEIFPAESCLVDTSDQFHLWCTRGAPPFGFKERLVAEATRDMGYGSQRPFDDHVRPDHFDDVEAKLKASGVTRKDSNN